MIWTDTSIGRAYANERDVVVRNKDRQSSYQGVLYVHGSEGGDGGSSQWMGIKTRWPVMRAVGEKCLMVCADLSGNQTWGNDTAISRLSAARTYMRGIAGVKQGRVNILAQSMGATTALAWAAANPTLVGRIVLMIPVINLSDVHANSSMYRPYINAAWRLLHRGSIWGYAQSSDHGAAWQARWSTYPDVVRHRRRTMQTGARCDVCKCSEYV